MSLNLAVGPRAVIAAAAPQGGANLDPFRSFWLGYTFTLGMPGGAVQIGNGYLAVYCSHPSDRDIPARAQVGPQLAANYGPVAEPVKISDTNNNALTLKNLDYIAAEDCECANQAMQLHVFKFNPARQGGVASWVDDNGWHAPALPQGNVTNNNKPFWKRTVGFNNGHRYCHFIARHRNAGGLQTVAAALPFGSGSLFKFWLTRHGQQMPALTFTANGDHTNQNPNAVHWTEPAGPQQLVAGRLPRGLAVVSMGVFGALRPTDLMQDHWRELMDGNHDFDLCRALARAASDGSKPHTLRQLGLHSEDCVVTAQNDSPQEFFYLRLTA